MTLSIFSAYRERARHRPPWSYPFSSVHGFIACGAGSGLLRPAAGTWGSFVALPLYYLLFPARMPTALMLVELLVLFVLGCWASHQTGIDLGVMDHNSIVWDEMVAVWLIFILMPMSFLMKVVAITVFRVFDIFKPFPCSWIDRHMKTGFGVMLDDIVAAVYALLVLKMGIFMADRMGFHVA